MVRLNCCTSRSVNERRSRRVLSRLPCSTLQDLADIDPRKFAKESSHLIAKIGVLHESSEFVLEDGTQRKNSLECNLRCRPKSSLHSWTFLSVVGMPTTDQSSSSPWQTFLSTWCPRARWPLWQSTHTRTRNFWRFTNYCLYKVNLYEQSARVPKQFRVPSRLVYIGVRSHSVSGGSEVTP